MGDAELFTIEVDSEVTLEAQWNAAAEPKAAAVFCHPHPLHGGSMRAPLMAKVTDALVEHGMSVLRFNFRGVGASTGTWSNGIGEVDDVAAAVATATERAVGLPLTIGGWSFGALMSLRWQARTGSTLSWAGIAPPSRLGGSLGLPPPDDLAPATRTIVIGDRDQFASVEEISQYAAAIGSMVEVLGGSDHFFYFREDKVAEVIAEALCPECGHAVA